MAETSIVCRADRMNIQRIAAHALVIGGGASGMTAALSLAEQGFHAYLIEKTDTLGGNLKNVDRLLDGTKTLDFLENPQIHLQNGD